MDYYIIQREERDIDVDLTNQLIEILMADLGIPKIDAKIKIRHFYGMLQVSDKKQAEKVSADFQKAGLNNFILKEDELIALPKRERLYEKLEEINDIPELIAAGKVADETQETIHQWSPLDVKYGSFVSMVGYPVIDSGLKKRKKTKKQTIYYIDMITRKRHWGISKPMVPLRDIKYLEKLDILKTYLTRDMRKLFQGQWDIMIFPDKKHYNKYLTWLVQLAFRPR